MTQNAGRVASNEHTIRMDALLAAMRSSHQKLGEQIDALESLVHEDPSPGQLAKKALDYFVSQWQARYKTTYMVNGAKDVAQLKRLFVGSSRLDADDYMRRVDAYLHGPMSNEPFWVQARHPMGLLLVSLNKLGCSAEVQEITLSSPVSDCRHRPECRSDAEHTQRKLREMRT